MSDFPYMVIYPRGNRKLLDTAYVRFYEEADWDLASKRRFETEEEAETYAKELSDRHGIPFRASTAYLD